MMTAKVLRPSPLTDLRGPQERAQADALARKVQAVWANKDRPAFHLEMALSPVWLNKRR